MPVQFFSLFQFSKSVHSAVYDYQILEAVHFRSTDVSRMSKRVYYADRTLGMVNFFETIMQILALSRIEREWIFTTLGTLAPLSTSFFTFAKYKLRAL